MSQLFILLYKLTFILTTGSTNIGGAKSVLFNDGMTRAPLIRMPSAERAAALKFWLEKQDNYYQIAAAFNSTSRFARLTGVSLIVVKVST